MTQSIATDAAERLEQLLTSVEIVIEDLEIEARRAFDRGEYGTGAKLLEFRNVLKGAVRDGK